MSPLLTIRKPSYKKTYKKDYKLGFDTVDRDKLWETLEKLKTSSKMINMIKAIYN